MIAAITFTFVKVVSPPVIILNEFPAAPATVRLVAIEEVLFAPPATVAVLEQAYSRSFY